MAVVWTVYRSIIAVEVVNCTDLVLDLATGQSAPHLVNLYSSQRVMRLKAHSLVVASAIAYLTQAKEQYLVVVRRLGIPR